MTVIVSGAESLPTPEERAEAVDLLWEQFENSPVDMVQFRRDLIVAWMGCSAPHLYLTNTQWRRMFRLAGYTINGKVAASPNEPLALYRAAPFSRRSNWSWSPNLAVAKYYQRVGPGAIMMEQSTLWTCTVPPDRVLARIREVGRVPTGLTARRATEILLRSPLHDEYIADVDGLNIQRYG